MTCCETFAKIWMSIACFLFTISGLALAGFTVYAQVFLTDNLSAGSEVVEQLLSPLRQTTGLWWVFGAGLGLALLSIAVWVATCHHENKCSKVILAICATFVLILIIAIAAAATAFIMWTEGKAGSLEGYINKVVEGTNNDTIGWMCCQRNNATLPAIVAPKTVNCNGTVITDTCYPSVCLTKSKPDGKTWLEGCTSNADFLATIKTWIKYHIQWVAIAALVVGLIDLCSFILMCVLVCKKSRDNNYYTNYHSSGPYV